MKRIQQINTLDMFRKLYDERFNNLVIYSVGIGVPYDHAKDIVQECFIRLWENHDKISNPVAYVFTSVRNSSLNWLKSDGKASGTKVSLEDAVHPFMDDSSIEEAVEHFNKVEEAYRRIMSLTGRCKEIFTRVYVDKVKIKDVAGEFEISENTVKTYLKRAKEALRLL